MTYSLNAPLEIAGVAWDAGNRDKCQKHGVSIGEIEALCRSPAFAIRPDRAHSVVELRFQGIGKTVQGRHVFLVFTMREREGKIFIRPIGARYMHAKEVNRYEQNNPDLQDR
ncbi:BrnT family toxin [Methylocapsa sp. S129]|uniref:BrnT family toxin n=1 Tax=Methylocapsa sp. S129 TaxID=1641869 RepID=UPI00131C9B1B|nr:BrnT family toxin [Methylocapsa sp. S129]